MFWIGSLCNPSQKVLEVSFNIYIESMQIHLNTHAYVQTAKIEIYLYKYDNTYLHSIVYTSVLPWGMFSFIIVANYM